MSTTSKFTAGPWVARPDKNSSCEWEVVKTEASLADGAWFIADVHDGPDGCSSEDNARLIAAAPELYEALINAPIPGRGEEMMAFRDRQDVWIETHYAPVLAALAKSGAA